MTPELAQRFPDELTGTELPEVLLPYQQRVLASTSEYAVTVCEKSRRIGVTWAIAADAVLTSGAAREAGGMDTFYIGYEKEMTREFIDTAAMWAKAFGQVAEDYEEFLFADGGGDETRAIQAFRIRFASGYDITALCSRPRSLRGRQGYVIIDEAAFHDELPELLKSAFALLIWGGRVLVISTHNGAAHPFNQLVEDIRSGAQKGNLIRITFDDALADGLYRRICLTKGREWSPEAEQAWAAEIRGIYRSNAAEELDVIPKNAGGAYLPRVLIEARSSRDIPVIRWRCDDKFIGLPETVTQELALQFCERELRPHLSVLDRRLPCAFGQDFGRSGDLSCMWPLQIQRDLVRRTIFTLELGNVPFAEQRLIAFYILDRLPMLGWAVCDASGNGAAQAEAARRKFGEHKVEELKLSTEWYRINMPPYKAAFEGASILIPADIDVRADHELITMADGVAKVPAGVHTTGSDGHKRHGDTAIAGALAWYASKKPVQNTEVRTSGIDRAAAGNRDYFGDDRGDDQWRRM
jgi:phage FluMu gp28-like protein